MTIDSTDAKIGRSMKKCENMAAFRPDKETRRQGDKETRRRHVFPFLPTVRYDPPERTGPASDFSFSLSPCLLVSLSPWPAFCLVAFAASSRASGDSGGFGGSCILAWTCAPGRTRCMPLMITWSPFDRPSLPSFPFSGAWITRSPAIACPSLTGRYSTFVLVVDDPDVLPSLVALQSFVGNEQRRIRCADRQTDAHEQAGFEGAIGVLKHAAHADGAGRGDDPVIDEVDGSRHGV